MDYQSMNCQQMQMNQMNNPFITNHRQQQQCTCQHQHGTNNINGVSQMYNYPAIVNNNNPFSTSSSIPPPIPMTNYNNYTNYSNAPNNCDYTCIPSNSSCDNNSHSTSTVRSCPLSLGNHNSDNSTLSNVSSNPAETNEYYSVTAGTDICHSNGQFNGQFNLEHFHNPYYANQKPKCNNTYSYPSSQNMSYDPIMNEMVDTFSFGSFQRDKKDIVSISKPETHTPNDKASNGTYHCSVCGKAFKHKCNLKIHSVIHTSSALQCSYCEKKFARISNLNEHIKIHTNFRPFRCQFCDKRFRQKQTLIDHIRTHTGERPFKCDFCNKAFKVKHNLKSHRRLHTGERPFVCPLCPKKFASKSSLNGHMRRKHEQYWANRKK